MSILNEQQILLFLIIVLNNFSRTKKYKNFIHKTRINHKILWKIIFKFNKIVYLKIKCNYQNK